MIESKNEKNDIANTIHNLNIDYESINVSMHNLRIQIKQIEINLKKYEKDKNKLIDKLIKKVDSKQNIKIKQKRKPTGFAAKSNINNTLKEFLNNNKVQECIIELENEKSKTFENIDKDGKISRISVTKIINRYIKNNNLSKSENKQCFIPNKLLKTILTPLEEKDKNGKGYTILNIQKYTKHLYI